MKYISLPLFICLCLSESLSAKDYVPEPMIMRSEALAQMFRLSPVQGRFQLGAEGSWGASLARTYANFWGYDNRYIIDSEMKDDQLRLRYQPADLWQIDFGFADRGFSSLGTDGMAIGFHDIFGLEQDGRLDAQRNVNQLSVPGFGLNYSNASLGTSLSRRLDLGLTYDLAQHMVWPFAMTLSGAVSHEFAAPNPYFTGVTDGWIQASISEGWSQFALYSSLTLAIFDSKTERGINTYRQQWSGIAGAAYAWTPGQETLLQGMYNQSLFREMGQLGRGSYEIQLAHRMRFGDWAVELGLIENIFWVYNSPDWGISLGASYQFEDESPL